MNKITTLLALTAAALLALPPTIQAQEQKGKHAMKLDTNRDGQLSRDEVKARPRLEKNFDRVDANKDGQLSRDELAAAHGKVKNHRAPKAASSPQ